MNNTYVVIQENKSRNCIYDGYEYYIVPEDQYNSDCENGMWQHSSYELLKHSLSKEDAEHYVEDLKNTSYIVVTCDDYRFNRDPFIDTVDNDNIINQPSLFTIHYEGTEEECEKYIEENF